MSAGRTETVRVEQRRKVKVERFFLTHAWPRRGVIEADGYEHQPGSATNWGMEQSQRRDDHFTGKIGYSVFRTREEAVEAVKKKAAAKARELRRKADALDRIAEQGPDDAAETSP